MSRVFLDFRGTGQGAHGGCYGPDQASGGVRLWLATCGRHWGRPERQQCLEETKAWRYLLQETAGQPWFHMLLIPCLYVMACRLGPIWLRVLLLTCRFDDCFLYCMLVVTAVCVLPVKHLAFGTKCIRMLLQPHLSLCPCYVLHFATW